MDTEQIDGYVLAVTVLLSDWNRVLIGTLVAASQPDLRQLIAQEQIVLLHRLAALTPPDSLRRLHDDLVHMAQASLAIKATGLDQWTDFNQALSDFEEAVQTIHVELNRLREQYQVTRTD